MVSVFDRGPGQSSLSSEDFFRCADHLERLAQGGDVRVGARNAQLGSCAGAIETLLRPWHGPNATGFTTGLGRLVEQARSAEPGCGEAYGALARLAADARQTGQVIREVEGREKSWNQQVVANWSEWQDRGTTALAGVFGDDAAS